MPEKYEKTFSQYVYDHEILLYYCIAIAIIIITTLFLLINTIFIIK